MSGRLQCGAAFRDITPYESVPGILLAGFENGRKAQDAWQTHLNSKYPVQGEHSPPLPPLLRQGFARLALVATTPSSLPIPDKPWTIDHGP